MNDATLDSKELKHLLITFVDNIRKENKLKTKDMKYSGKLLQLVKLENARHYNYSLSFVANGAKAYETQKSQALWADTNRKRRQLEHMTLKSSK